MTTGESTNWPVRLDPPAPFGDDVRWLGMRQVQPGDPDPQPLVGRDFAARTRHSPARWCARIPRPSRGAEAGKLEAAAVRWHGRLEVETPLLSLADSQLAIAALAALCAGDRDAVEILRRLLRRVRPTAVSPIG